jgi:hypothetical protein
MTFAMVWPRVLAAGTPTIWVLSCLAFVCIGLAVIVMKNPTVLGTGQDAAGKAMTVGCTMFLLTGGALVLGLIAAVLAWRNDGVTMATRIVATTPPAIVGLALAIGFVVSQLEAARRAEAEHAAKMAIPIFLLVDDKDENLTAMYDALNSRYPVTEMQLRKPGVLHWQLSQFVPRARILCVNADVPPQVDEAGLTNDSRMIVDDLSHCKPSGPILLFSRDPAQAQPYAQKLVAAGWKVHVVARTGDDWFTSGFLTSASEILKDYVEPKRP